MSALVDRFGAPLIRCQCPGCARRAEVAPEVCVPGIGHALDQCLAFMIGLKLCRKHGEAEKAETFLTESFQLMVVTIAGRGSSVPPDFDRAYIKLQPIGGEKYRKFEEMSEEGRAGRQRRLN